MNNRLFLRPFLPEDGPLFYENVMRDSSEDGLFGLNPVTPEAARDYVSVRAAYSSRSRFYDYAVVREEDNAVIGEINAAFIPPESADVGYVIGTRFRKNGYGREALNLLLEKLHDEGIRTVYGACERQNDASKAVMHSCGMKPVKDVPDNVKRREESDHLMWFVKQDR